MMVYLARRRQIMGLEYGSWAWSQSWDGLHGRAFYVELIVFSRCIGVIVNKIGWVRGA